MRYHLALLPDRGDGEPDYSANPGPILLLPEGTTRMKIFAYGSVTSSGASLTEFQDGTVFDVALED